MDDISIYNPLDKINLGANVADAMLRRQVYPMNSLPQFNGAGIYAIYYTGDFEAYTKLAEMNRNGGYALPIYVGKAVHPGARKGNFRTDSEPGKALYNRLGDHAQSIEAASNLRLSDFACRFLVVDDIWIPLGESLLIAKFSPVWNKLLDGFGNHNPGRGRYNGVRPKWDTLHPGRSWAERCAARPETAEQIAEEVKAYLMAL
jgi:hypothetical protein